MYFKSIHSKLALALFLGLALRVGVLLISIGTNDMLTWTRFAILAELHGVLGAYAIDPRLNHPPIMLLYALGCLRVSRLFGIDFDYLFKLGPVLADVGTAYLLARLWDSSGGNKGWIPASRYGLSIVPILVSAFHGNTDSLCVFLIVCGIFLLQQAKKPLLAGVVFALAVNVKLIAVFPLIPITIYLLIRHTPRLSFIGGGVLGFLLFDLPFLLIDGSWIHNLTSYRSNIEPWGLMVFVHLLSDSGILKGLNMVSFNQVGAYLLFAILALLPALFRKRMSNFPALLGGAALSLFLVLAPGFGVQYLVYPSPFMALRSRIWWLLCNLTCGLFLIAVYWQFLIEGFPLSTFHDRAFAKGTVLIGLFAWLCLVFFTGSWLKLARSANR